MPRVKKKVSIFQSMMSAMGYVPAPKKRAGKVAVSGYVRGVASREPAKITTSDLKEATVAEGGREPRILRDGLGFPVDVVEQRANLCDVCKASAQDCRKADAKTFAEGNTVTCDQYK